MPVVHRIAGKSTERAEEILALLGADELSGQEIADALILAMVLHIERSASDHFQHAVACGVADAIRANFETA